MSRIEIKPSCLRDTSYVFGNLNPADLAEVSCQLPDGVRPQQLAPIYVGLPRSLVAYVDDVPAMAFGVGMINAACASAWAVGTVKSWRAVPDVTRFWHDELVPWTIDRGFRFVEARSLVTNVRAHRWMESLGAEAVTDPLPFGKADEPFILFRWTVASYRSIYGEPVAKER